MTEATPVMMASAIRPWGATTPVAWPRDGKRETQEGAGQALAVQFRNQGLNMMHTFTCFDNEMGEKNNTSLEAGLMMMFDMFSSGRLKIFSDLRELLEELSMYHRKEGRVVKEREDTICVLRYILMMRRFCEAPQKSSYGRGGYRSRPGGLSWMGA